MLNNSQLQNFLSATEWFNFELTNYCNIPCIYCDNKKLRNKGYMTFDHFKTIVDKLFNFEKSNKNIIFCGYGEPFLNDKIYDMIDYVYETGVDLTIQSNGKWKINEARIDSLFKINRLSVTIDAVSNDILELSRPNTDVNAIFENLNKIVNLKNILSKQKPSITAKMNVFTFNKHQAHEFIGKCTELKLDQICLAKGCGPAEVMTTINRSEYDKYNCSNIDIAKSLFEASSNLDTDKIQPNCNKHENSKAIRSNPAKLFQILGCFNTATIKWDGTLLPCCWDIDAQLPLGNLATNNLEDIFTPENLDRVGSRILRDRNNPFTKIPCLRCSKFTSHFNPGIPVIAKRLLLQNVFKAHRNLLKYWQR
ncbi:radical SAM protein [Geomobilimonas luticola]|uniref:Radical SAM protein n=1 Tax=Geomobilimonas luticola TaxID=1114878 RepID=A0ABS5SEC5_9BACT|nr:radical SAM protein [Geomobilimonas luticola]MBT0653715.1 radical SAM protein [Geomobilimonas luticola]